MKISNKFQSMLIRRVGWVLMENINMRIYVNFISRVRLIKTDSSRMSAIDDP